MYDKKEYTIKATLEERTSKSGSKYEALILKFGDYEKIVFLEKAEKALLKEKCK